MRVKNINRLETTAMRMLQMTCGKALKEKIGNECDREINEVEGNEKVMRSQCMVRAYEKICYACRRLHTCDLN